MFVEPLNRHVVVVVYLATIIWSVSESWGGDVPASDSDPFVHILRHYLLCKLLIFLTRSDLLRPSLFSVGGGGGVTTPAPGHSPVTVVVLPHRIICPPERHLSPSQHSETHRYLHRPPTPLRNCLLRPCLACRI